MKECFLNISSTQQLAPSVFRTVLSGDVGLLKAGQFVDVKLNGFTLRRPISLCDFTKDSLTLVYKTVGEGTQHLSNLPVGTQLDVLCGLGNGYDLTKITSNSSVLLVGGGLGTPPLYSLAKALMAQNIDFSVVLGFNTQSEIILLDEFASLGKNVTVTTVDGSFGTKGFVTAVNMRDCYIFACGPMPMLKAVYNASADGQYSLEARMGCGFGVCYGCTIQTTQGPLRVCADGPVFKKEQLIW